jgi:peptide-methionine (R)-S-oxide reductase
MKRYEIERSDAEWRELLPQERYRVLRQSATERPFTGTYVDTEDPGVYRCGACGSPLFRSDAKYHSGCGWPSFFEPVTADALEEVLDTSHGMRRTEIRCGTCGSHIGHVFEDGPEPTGLRYCTNSIALDLEREGDEE